MYTSQGELDRVNSDRKVYFSVNVFPLPQRFSSILIFRLSLLRRSVIVKGYGIPVSS